MTRAKLTSREREILSLACIEDLTTAEIADRLHIAEKTVSWHLSNVYKFLRVNTRIGAYNAAMTRGILAPPAREPGDGAAGDTFRAQRQAALVLIEAAARVNADNLSVLLKDVRRQSSGERLGDWQIVASRLRPSSAISAASRPISAPKQILH